VSAAILGFVVAAQDTAWLVTFLIFLLGAGFTVALLAAVFVRRGRARRELARRLSAASGDIAALRAEAQRHRSGSAARAAAPQSGTFEEGG
jgi:hypothetical protein